MSRFKSICLTVSLLLPIYGCSGGKSLEKNLAPDPKLTQPAKVSTSTPATPVPNPSPKNSPPVVEEAPAKPETIATETPDYLADLKQLGIFSSTDTAISRGVTRREYAHWLIAAYNKINSKKSTLQIRLATAENKPAFQDIPATHPDFPSIQGLAEAGIIPSFLSGDPTVVLFRPEASLTREELILWKVPLDTHQPLQTATLAAVQQTWGFQDVGKIEPKALRAVLADFQNGDRSNIRRGF